MLTLYVAEVINPLAKGGDAQMRAVALHFFLQKAYFSVIISVAPSGTPRPALHSRGAGFRRPRTWVAAGRRQ